MRSLSRRALLYVSLGVALSGCERRVPRARTFFQGLASAKLGPEPPPALGPFDVDPELFERKRAAAPGDWLAQHAEAFQSYETYVVSEPVRPTRGRSRIVLQPLGAFSRTGRELLDAVREHATNFFSIPAEIAEGMALPRGRQRTRTSGSRRPWQQHHTGTILKALAARLPGRAVAYLGVTEADLYPEASWNFVFGEATLSERVGTYSLARFLPPFAGVGTPSELSMAVRRSVQLLAHETGHVFSLPHCVRFECVMNGSNSLAESDRAPLELCPDCLRKLAYATGCDPVERYVALHRFFGNRSRVRSLRTGGRVSDRNRSILDFRLSMVRVLGHSVEAWSATGETSGSGSWKRSFARGTRESPSWSKG